MERNEAIGRLRLLYSATNAENKAALECLIPELKVVHPDSLESLKRDENMGKYEETLERAREIYANPREALKDNVNLTNEGSVAAIKVALLDLFPMEELAESEDERIREFIAKTVFRYYGDSQEYLDVLAYLEKQRVLSELGKYIAAERTKPGFMFNGNDSASWEELPLYVRKHDYPYYFIGDLDCYPFDVEKQKEQKPVKVYDNMDDLIADAMIDEIGKSDMPDSAKHNRTYWINKHRQKPVEWSEEDKRAIDRACVALRAYSNGDLPEFLPSELLDYADRLQSLRPQQKQEWNEKDEKILDSLIRLYSIEYSANAWPWANGVFTYGDVVNFLKSLRPDSYKNCNSRWKPSEEQMEALHTVAYIKEIDYYGGLKDRLRELYDDLKKLI